MVIRLDDGTYKRITMTFNSSIELSVWLPKERQTLSCLFPYTNSLNFHLSTFLNLQVTNFGRMTKLFYLTRRDDQLVCELVVLMAELLTKMHGDSSGDVGGQSAIRYYLWIFLTFETTYWLYYHSFYNFPLQCSRVTIWEGRKCTSMSSTAYNPLKTSLPLQKLMYVIKTCLVKSCIK